MRPTTLFLRGLLCFLLLNLAANLLPYYVGNFPDSAVATAFMGQPLYWLGYWLGFFVFAALLSKYLLGLQGLTSFGMELRKGWLKQLLLGFLLGAGLKTLQYLLFYGLDKFEVTSLVEPSAMLPIVLLGLLVALFPSAINDVAIRGFLLGFFRKTGMLRYFLLTAAGLYALDDAWNEGFSLTNTLFSLFYGLALAYTVLRTGALWMSIGLHSGGNFLYRLMYGMDGQGLLVLEEVRSGPLYEYVNVLLAAGACLLVYLILRKGPALRPQMDTQ